MNYNNHFAKISSPMIILLPLVIIVISLLVLFPIFYVGLHGDDWLVIFRYVVHLSPSSKEGWNYFSYFLTPYGSQDIMMGLLYRYFGNQPIYFEITSYIFRMIAAFSLYPLVYYLTKNRLATFFSILFFAITTTGFSTSGWLSALPTYPTIALFNLFLYFYLLVKETQKLKFLILSGIFFYFAYVTGSARMVGAPLFIISLEMFWFIISKTKNSLKFSFIRILFISAILIIISISGNSLGSSHDWLDKLNSGLTTIEKLISEGRTDFLLYPIVTIGGMIIPNFAFPSIQINTAREMLFSVALPSFTLFMFLMFIFKTNISKLGRKDIYKNLIAAAIWIFIVFIIHKMNPNTFSGSNLILMAVTGGLTIIIWTWLAFKYRSKQIILNALFISFSWTLFSFFLAWVWNPSSYIDSTHRYLTTSAIGISILFAVIISLGKKFNNKLILTLLLLPILTLHIISTRTYINTILFSHATQTTNKIWSSIPHIPIVGIEPIIFYFETDSSNGSILGEGVLFGFPFHMALLYNLSDAEKTPLATQDWNQVVSAVKSDSKLYKSYGHPAKPLPIDHVYGFRLQGRDKLIDITEIIRKKLAELE